MSLEADLRNLEAIKDLAKTIDRAIEDDRQKIDRKHQIIERVRNILREYAGNDGLKVSGFPIRLMAALNSYHRELSDLDVLAVLGRVGQHEPKKWMPPISENSRRLTTAGSMPQVRDE